MTFMDWVLVISINLAIVIYGIRLGRGTKTTKEWFLAARGLPWWIVGLSAFATAADAGDYVALAGGSYSFGMSNITAWWLGLPIGWFLVSYFIYVPMYRARMFTNAEWLEHRFGPSVRLLSVFIQIQYRTNVLGNIAWSLFPTLRIVGGLDNTLSWGIVVMIATLAAWYSAQGGLKSVAITDVLQYITMAVSSLVLWLLVWQVGGGWSGLETQLDVEDRGWMLHVGGYQEPGVPIPLVILGWIIVHVSYNAVNHSQAMRFLGARSEWDMKMGALVAGGVTVVVMWLNITLGIMGRALFPNLEVVDQVFPLLVSHFLAPGLMGLVLAGILGAGMSTYDSISNAISAIFTRDFYARFIKKDGSDEHYLRVSRMTVPVVIGLGFLYIPFLKAGAIQFYLSATSVFVLPLAVLYLMGALTTVHRSSGVVGLVAGATFGFFAFLARGFHWPLPIWISNIWWGYLWNLLVPAVSMLVYSWYINFSRGPVSEKELSGLTYHTRHLPFREHSQGIDSKTNWLERSRMDLGKGLVLPFLASKRLSWYQRDRLLVWIFLIVLVFFNLVVFW